MTPDKVLDGGSWLPVTTLVFAMAAPDTGRISLNASRQLKDDNA